MSSVEEIAHKIAHEELPFHPYSPHVDRQSLARRIAAALASERAKLAAFADENGEPRKVLGTLPLTVEGDIIGDGAWCWFIFPGVSGKDDDVPARVMYKPMPIVDPDAYRGSRRVHSSRESALAAAKEQK